MIALRERRRALGLGQREFALVLSVPLETFRTWDSGRRPVPPHVLGRVDAAIAEYLRQRELLALDQLAGELHVHVRTLQAAARTGRLETHFSTRSVFGRPVRSASRAAAEQFMLRHYRRFGGQERCAAPLPAVPDNYDLLLRDLRLRLGLTQQAVARRVGAASKAVVYQWESRKRRPSPVFWQRIQALDPARV